MESTQQSKKLPVLRYTITNQTMTYKAPSCGVVFHIISETNIKIKKIIINRRKEQKVWEQKTRKEAERISAALKL